MHPETAAQTRLRYHLRDEAQHAALDRLWSDRVTADPRLGDTLSWYVRNYH